MHSKFCALVTTALLLTPITTSPASAAGLVLTCEFHYVSYGRGTSTGTGVCDVNGIPRAEIMTFTTEQPESGCPAQEYTYGSMSGVIDASFSFSRPSGSFSTWNGFNGTGVIAYAVTSHVGNPCGKMNVKATATILVAG